MTILTESSSAKTKRMVCASTYIVVMAERGVLPGMKCCIFTLEKGISAIILSIKVIEVVVLVFLGSGLGLVVYF